MTRYRILSYLAGPVSTDLRTASRQLLTRRWWKKERHKSRLVASEAVEDECSRGQPARAQSRLALLAEATTLTMNVRILELAGQLVAPGGLPSVAATDALHIAVAAIHEIDYLATWNMRHIANAHIRLVTERIIEKNGYQRSVICTP